MPTSKYNYPVNPNLIKALALPPKLTPSQWVERYVILPKGLTDRPGRIRLQPWWREIIDTFDNRSLINRYIQSSAQQGKSIAMCCSLLFGIFQREQPAIIVFPDEASAVRYFRRVIIPIINESPYLRAKISNARSDMNKFEIITNSGIMLRVAWAGSAASLASTPAAFIVCDEVNKYKLSVKNEADPVSLAKDRMLSYMKSGPAFICASTPTDEYGQITKLIDESISHDWFVSCPKCHTETSCSFGSLDWDKTATIPHIENTPDSIQWKCSKCETKVKEHDFRKLARKGRWIRKENQDIKEKSITSHGWILNGILSETCPWKTLVSEFLQSKNDVLKLKNWKNSFCGEPFVDARVMVKKGFLESLIKDDLQEYRVPSECLGIVCGIDVGRKESEGDYHYWCVALAVMPGNRMCVVSANRLVGQKALQEWVSHEYLTPEDKIILPNQAFIDSGFDTLNIYNYCLSNPGFIPIKGASSENQSLPVKRSNIESLKTNFGTQRNLIAALDLYWINTTFFKDTFHSLSTNNQFSFVDQLAPELFEHIQNEVKEMAKTAKGVVYRYKPRYAGIAQHLWDALVYAMACSYKNEYFKHKTWDDWLLFNGEDAGPGAPDPYAGIVNPGQTMG